MCGNGPQQAVALDGRRRERRRPLQPLVEERVGRLERGEVRDVERVRHVRRQVVVRRGVADVGAAPILLGQIVLPDGDALAVGVRPGVGDFERRRAS